METNLEFHYISLLFIFSVLSCMRPPWYNGRVLDFDAKGRRYEVHCCRNLFSYQIVVFMQNLGLILLTKSQIVHFRELLRN